MISGRRSTSCSIKRGARSPQRASPLRRLSVAIVSWGTTAGNDTPESDRGQGLAGAAPRLTTATVALILSLTCGGGTNNSTNTPSTSEHAPPTQSSTIVDAGRTEDYKSAEP